MLSAITGMSFQDGGKHEAVPLATADTCKVLQSTTSHLVEIYPNLLVAGAVTKQLRRPQVRTACHITWLADPDQSSLVKKIREKKELQALWCNTSSHQSACNLPRTPAHACFNLGRLCCQKARMECRESTKGSAPT